MSQSSAGSVLSVDDQKAFWQAIKRNDANDVKAWVQKGADVNRPWSEWSHFDEKKDADFSDFPLAFAATHGAEKVVSVLLEFGADPQAVHPTGGPLLWSILNQKTTGTRKIEGSIELLLGAGSDANQSPWFEPLSTPLLKAAESGNFRIIDALLRHGADASKIDQHGYNALLLTIQHGSWWDLPKTMEVCENLIAHGALVNQVANDQHNVLSLLIESFTPHPDFVERLEKWLDPHPSWWVKPGGPLNMTPLKQAVNLGSIGWTRYLVGKHGPNEEVPKTAWVDAMRQDYVSAIEQAHGVENGAEIAAFLETCVVEHDRKALRAIAHQDRRLERTPKPRSRL